MAENDGDDGAVRIAIDFETAGSYPGCACALGMVSFEKGKPARRFYSLIRPPSEKIAFSHIHGLYWRDLKNAPTFSELWPQIRNFIGSCNLLIAHNASFDRSVFFSCCKRFNLSPPLVSFLCTLKGSRKRLPIPSRRLNCVCEYFNISLRHHHAESDALASGLIYARLKELGLEDEDMLLPAPSTRLKRKE